MSSNNNIKINAAYINAWQQKNPNLSELKIDGNYLLYKDKKIDISDIYIQDLLLNPNLFYNLENINSDILFNVIELHITALQIKEKEMSEKTRSWNLYEQE